MANLDPTSVSLLIFAGVSLLGVAAALVLRDLKRNRVADGGHVQPELVELDRISAGSISKGSISTGSVSTGSVSSAAPRGLADRLDRWFERLIAESGVTVSPMVAFLASLTVGLLIGGLLFLWKENPLLGALGLLAGMGMVWIYIAILRKRRLSKFREQLPIALDLMARAVRAGETLDQAIALVAASSSAPLAAEFHRCSRQLGMGLSLDAALNSLTLHVPLTETRVFAAALNVQRRTGGNLPVALERLATVIRDRMSYRRQFRASTATSRASTLVIVLSAAVLAVYLFVWRPEYVQRFFDSISGQMLLGLAIMQFIIALIWISKLLNPQY